MPGTGIHDHPPQGVIKAVSTAAIIWSVLPGVVHIDDNAGQENDQSADGEDDDCKGEHFVSVPLGLTGTGCTQWHGGESNPTYPFGRYQVSFTRAVSKTNQCVSRGVWVMRANPLARWSLR